MSSARYWVKIGGAVADIGEAKFGFRAPDYAYNGISDELGVTKISTNNDARGILFGANYPRPPRVRILYSDSNLGGGTGNDVKRGAIRFCDPDKLGRVLNGSLIDGQVSVDNNSYPISMVTMA